MYAPLSPTSQKSSALRPLANDTNSPSSPLSTASAHTSAKKAAGYYQTISTGSAGIETASPMKLTQMLFDGALARLLAAKGHMQRNETAKKGENIGKAIAIINELQHSLNLDQGGELAERLDGLYDYMLRQLTKANLENNPDFIDEVHHLLAQITEGWRQLVEG